MSSTDLRAMEWNGMGRGEGVITSCRSVMKENSMGRNQVRRIAALTQQLHEDKNGNSAAAGLDQI